MVNIPGSVIYSRHSLTVKKAGGRTSLVPAAVIAALVAAPIITLFFLAYTSGFDNLGHLLKTVLPRSTRTTAELLAMVAILTTLTGVFTAWVVNSCEFPLRRLLAWLLVLPLAIPPYIAAYTLTEFFHFTGPVQSAVRSLGGFQSARDYWFPDIRSTQGAALVLASVLYPYVYLTTRIVFLMQGRHIADVARTLGSTPARVLLRIQLPVARPAIVAGLALVMMETLNDIGAVEYLGVETLTLAVYSTWLNRGSLEGAAQIACGMLLLVAGLIWLEQWARRRQRFHVARSTQISKSIPRLRLSGSLAWLVSFICALPIVIGFVIPVFVLAGYAARRLYQLSEPALFNALLNSILVACAAAFLAIFFALVLANTIRSNSGPIMRILSRISVVGYALPGTILGIGLLIMLAKIDNLIGTMVAELTGERTGLILAGTATAVVYACTVRFLAVADSSIHSGFQKLPRDIDPAARLLGKTASQTAKEILFPLLRPAIMTAAVIVFVDTAKELSATILLRPFDFNTLSTLVYENASRGAVEDGAMAALMIVLVAVIPVSMLSKALMNDREI